MRILIIDDEAHIRKTTSVTLDTLGHECEQAQDSAEALALMKKSSFDAAFLDLRLGGENGLELIAKLLALEHKLNVIVFTAYSSIDTAVEAMRRGAVDYLAKPFTPEQISAKIVDLVRPKGIEWTGPVEIIFQTIENLHDAVPHHSGDWYFTGKYPTPGGYRVVNQAYINYFENAGGRSY